MLRFAEEIMLLLLDDDGRECGRTPMWSTRLVLAAAVLMDLALENCIDTDMDRLFPIDPRPLRDRLLDPTLARIVQTNQTHDTRYWLERIAEQGDDIRARALDCLVERGILRSQGKRSPWISRRSLQYVIANGEAQREAKARIIRVLSGTEIPAPHDVALICLADACGIFRTLLPGRELARVSDRLEQVRKMDLIGRTLTRAVWDIRDTLANEAPRRPLIGLALGAGAARGWAHIGAIRCLTEAGITPDIVCGTSVGALVGGFYAAGKLDILEQWAHRLTLGQMVRYLNVPLGSHLFGKANLFRELGKSCLGVAIEDMATPFAAVATELDSGKEMVVRSGSLFRAVLASSAYPGLLAPVKLRDRWMIDGAKVNPVPVTACRALGAQIVVAVSLSRAATARAGTPHAWLLARGAHGRTAGGQSPQSTAATADVLIEPRLSQVTGVLGANRAKRLIAEGRNAAERALSALKNTYLCLS